ncbi:MAG: HlyD family efflux transporter periplasmic adaptor subunit [Bacteroidota bacterium]
MDPLDKLAQTQLYSLRTLNTPGIGRSVAKVLLVLISLFILLLFLPWQQNIRGQGLVTALNPKNRPQTVQSAIAGRIDSWEVNEGDFVNRGDTLLTISEIKDKFFDPDLVDRLKEQIQAKKNARDAKEGKSVALTNQISALEDALRAKMSQAKNKIKQARLKLEGDSLAFVAEKVNNQNAISIFERNTARYEAGNITLTKFQELQTKFQKAGAEVLKAENQWLQQKANLANAKLELASLQADYADKISKSRSDLNENIASLNETIGEISKMTNELSNVEIRQKQYKIIAPQTGFVVQAVKMGIGETIKEGEAIVSILPDSKDIAAEMFVKAMDMPMLQPGRKVRIEFDGWPALQFSGWPNVGVGTFGGEVAIVDRVQSGNGMFRILVKPDPEDEDWPPQIRMGSGIKGWVMLNDVPIWYEVWRQMNGFPPTIYNQSEIADVKSTAKK